MPTVADLDLVSELEKLRAGIPPGSRKMLRSTQGISLRDVRTVRAAVEVLEADAIRLLREIPASQISQEHPAVAALATVLAHPEAQPRFFEALSPEQRAKVEAALPQRKMAWSADQLEWQWVQFCGTFTREQIDPRIPLPDQNFGSHALEVAWGALMDLQVLLAWGLIS